MDPVVSADLLRTFKPPHELARSRPREVRLAAGGRVLLAASWILAAAAIIATAALHAESRRQSRTAEQFDERSVVTTAIVDRL